MKSMALLLLSVSLAVSAAEPVYYTNGSSVCVRLSNEAVEFEMSVGQAHQILGQGVSKKTPAGYEFTFTDSFRNSGVGFVDHGQQLRLQLTTKDKHSPSAVLAAYGSYNIHLSVCGSDALRLSQGAEVQLAVPRDVHAFGVDAREPGRWASKA